ncbi:MAG: beta-galactosidase [Wujia sp.]
MDRIWKHDKIAYGGDYNPEQWPREVWDEDMRMFKEAGIDTVTLNVFSWATIQPSENEYDFSKLDEIVKLVTENDMKICLATSTGAHPAWMATRYPEILRVDFQGRKRKFGGRHNSCPNSPIYREYSAKLAGKLAEHYKNQPNLIGWHVSNEYGGDCYCENCERAFREWLKNRYKTLEAVNRAWNTSFWGHTFYDWDEIVLPNALSEHFEAYGKDRTQFQGISIDYKRFNSDSIMDCYRLEREAIKEMTPDIPVTTNFMGFYPMLDYHKWAKYIDFVAWDNYPSPNDPPALMAMNHDLMRGLKAGRPFCLMEQTPSVTNWQPYNKLKRPGVMRLWSYQAVAHGADTVMFFQMRRSIGACEKYHGAVIDHAGRTDTRVFREISALGGELKRLGDETLGATAKSKVAIVFDWNNWWGIDLSAGPSILIDYHKECLRYYQALHTQNISVDVIGVDADISEYDIVIAPILYMVKEGYDEKLRSYVRNGGTFVTTYFSGYVDDSDLVQGAYPGKLGDILGLWVEECDALPEGEKNSFVWNGKQYPARILCDIIRPVNAETLSVYEEDFYANETVISVNSYGEGKAYYIGTSSDDDFYMDFIAKLCAEKGIRPEFGTYDNLEVTARYKDGNRYLFLLNHGEAAIDVTMEYDCKDLVTEITFAKGQRYSLDKKDVMILKSFE